MLLNTTIALRNLIGSLDCGNICEDDRDGKFEQLMGHRRLSGSSSRCHLYHVCIGHAHLCQCMGVHMFDPVYIIYLSHLYIKNLLMYICLYFVESYPTAYVNTHLLDTPTIRHSKCDIIISEGERCSACAGQRKVLHAVYTHIS